MTIEVFKERINDLLTFAEKTAANLANEAGLELKSIHNWQNGENYPKLSALLILVDYFDVTTDYILGLDNSEEDRGKKGVTVEEAQSRIVHSLKEYLDEKEIKENRLARLLKTNQATVSHWLNNGSIPRTYMLMRISNLLNKPLEELLGRK